MRVKKFSNERALIWFSADELACLIATTEWVLKEVRHPAEFATRVARLRSYATDVLARLRVARDQVSSFRQARSGSTSPDTKTLPPVQNLCTPLRQLQVTLHIERVYPDKVLAAVTDHELGFLNNILNEVINGILEGRDFLESAGYTLKFGERVLDQIGAAHDTLQKRMENLA